MEESQIIDKPKIYQALGIVSGILELTEDRYCSLMIGEKSYAVTVSPKVWEKHQPGQLQNFKIYPAIRDRELGFSLRLITQKMPRESGIILKGCWEIHEEEPQLVIHLNFRTKRAKPTGLPLIWKEAPIADGKYWEIEAQLKGDKFEVTNAVGPFEAPRKYQKRVKKSFKNAKSNLPRPILKSAKAVIAELAPKEIEASAQASANGAPEVELIAIGTSGEIEENNIEAKAIDVSEGIASNEIKEIVETASEPIAESLSELIAVGASGAIEPAEMEGSPVVAEPVTPKRKKASSKSTASKKLSITEGASKAITPENAEAKKERAKSSGLKKQTGASATRLFLGKQLPPGK
jgi:hypothetical protein